MRIHEIIIITVVAMMLASLPIAFLAESVVYHWVMATEPGHFVRWRASKEAWQAAKLAGLLGAILVGIVVAVLLVRLGDPAEPTPETGS